MKKIYKTPIGITSQFSFCGLPFRLDSYAGCEFSCTYCFARLRGGNSNSNRIRIANPNYVINKFKNALSNPNIASGIISEFIRNKTPIHFGGMSDPFQPIEEKEQVTFKILKFLCDIRYPIIISTKSNLIKRDKYLSLLKRNPNILVQFSFSTLNNNKSKLIEPNTDNPTKIMRTVEILSSMGINTSIRWQPYIPGISDNPESFVKKSSSLGVRHIGLEHLKLPIEKTNPLWQKLLNKINFDIRDFYVSNNSNQDGREFVLPPEFKIRTALETKKLCNKFNITFGAADNEIQYLSDTNCCCSGADQFKGFKNWNKFQISYAIKKSKNRLIKIDSILNYWYPKGSIDKYLNSQTRIKKSDCHNTVKSYIYDRWENLNSSFNPSRYYGVKYTGSRDNDGHRIYKWSL